MSEELTENQIFMRDMAKMHCGCSFSGYVRCEEHKDVPLPEPTYTTSQVQEKLDEAAQEWLRLGYKSAGDINDIIEAIAVKVGNYPFKQFVSNYDNQLELVKIIREAKM